jgi:hypothetical protein
VSIDFNTATSAEIYSWIGTQNWDDAAPGVKDQATAIATQRSIQEQVGVAVQQIRTIDAGKKMDSKAEKDWPELLNKESAMYKRVAAEMEKDPDALNKPGVYLDIANRVGLEMGMTPAGFQPARAEGTPMDGIGSGDGASPDQTADPGEDFLNRTKDIGKAFEGILDMNDKDTRERIAKRVEDGGNG